MITNNLFQNFATSYPIFQPNQVLTNKHLNRIVDYLEQQDRLTRICLIGTGIVCGLEIIEQSATDTALEISAGCGITSEGYLVNMPNVTLTHQATNRTLRKELLGVTIVGGANNELSLVELCQSPPSSGTNAADQEVPFIDGAQALQTTDLQNKVVLLLLECEDQQNELCLNDCDTKGAERNFRLRPFLVEPNLAEGILAESYQVQAATGETSKANLEKAFYGQFQLDDLYLERFGHSTTTEADGSVATSTRLDTLVNYGILQSRYEQILRAASPRIKTVLEVAHLAFSPIFSGSVNTAQLDLANTELAKIDAAAGGVLPYHRFELQYVYDHLCDLVQAYREFFDVVLDLVADCPPNTGCFPKHLWLGILNPTTNQADLPISIYRTPYTQPPIYNGNRNRLKEAKLLFERLQKVLTTYQIPQNYNKYNVQSNDIKLTPSKLSAPLSQQAIPFYYNDVPQLSACWNAKNKRYGKSNHFLSYHRSDTVPFKDPLVFNLQGNDFLRVEGHIGKDFRTVMTKLEDWQSKYNLPFDVLALKVGGDFNEEVFLFECELEAYEAFYEKKRAELLTQIDNISGDPNDLNLDADKERLRTTLPDALKDFDYPAFESNYTTLEVSEPSPSGLDPTGKVPFEQVHHCYQDALVCRLPKLEQMKQRHIFHNFAADYPGMEHKGGVPIGGTFILAYVDAEVIEPEIETIKTSIEDLPLDPATIQQLRLGADEFKLVIADFYLPYMCVSNCVPLCQVIERPKPVLLIGQTVFCENDSTAYPLTVHPFGGILTINGAEVTSGNYEFIASQIQVEADPVFVEIRYNLDGAETTLTVEVRPLPIATFTLLDETGLTQLEVTDPTTLQICVDRGPVQLIPDVPAEISVFEATRNDGTPLTIVETGDGIRQFIPSSLGLDISAPVEVILRQRVTVAPCSNSAAVTLSVLPLPNPNFTIGGGISEICSNAQAVNLLPDLPNGTFTALLNGNVQEGAILNNTQFDPAVFAPLFNGNDNLEVEIRHEITDANTCGNSAVQAITVFRAPDAAFAIESASACAIVDSRIALSPTEALGTFTALVDGNEIPAGIFMSNGVAHFRPDSVDFGIEEAAVTEVEVTIQHELNISYPPNGHTCSDVQTGTIRVFALPDAEFAVPRLEYCTDEPAAELIPATAGGTFTASLDDGTAVPNAILNNTHFNPAAFAGIFDANLGLTELQVIIRYEVIDVNGCPNQFTQSVLVFPTPDASFALSAERVCINANGVALTPGAVDEFRAFDEDGQLIAGAIIQGANGAEFLPSTVALGERLAATITITRTVVANICGAEHTETLTVLALPNAAFEPNRSPVCVNERTLVNLQPQRPDGTFSTFPAVANAIVSGNQLDPRAFAAHFEDNPNTMTLNVQIMHLVEDEDGCAGTTQESITILRAPNADFAVSQTEVCEDDDPVDLSPAGGIGTSSFRALNGDQAILDAIIPANGAFQFVPSVVQLGSRRAVTVTIEHTRTNGICQAVQTVDIRVVARPAVSFDAIAILIDGDFYQVRISNAQPSGVQVENWTLTPPPPNGVSSIGGGSFRANYGESQSPGTVIQVELQVEGAGGACPGIATEEVTLPFELTGFEIIGGDGEGLANRGRRQVLRDKENIKISIDSLNGTFNIRAIANPSTIGQVTFRLTGQQTHIESSTTAGNYRLLDKSTGLPAEVGFYKIQAVPIDAFGLESKPITAIFELLPSTEDAPGEEVITVVATSKNLEANAAPNEAAIVLLNRRASSQRNEIAELEADRSLTQTKTFKIGKLFSLFSGTPELVNERFAEATTSILSTLKRSKGARRKQYTKLLTAVTHNYLDKQVAAQPASISTTTHNTLKAVVANMKSADVEVAKIRKNWKGAELKTVLDGKAVDQLNRLLK